MNPGSWNFSIMILWQKFFFVMLNNRKAESVSSAIGLQKIVLDNHMELKVIWITAVALGTHCAWTTYIYATVWPRLFPPPISDFLFQIINLINRRSGTAVGQVWIPRHSMTNWEWDQVSKNLGHMSVPRWYSRTFSHFRLLVVYACFYR